MNTIDMYQIAEKEHIDIVNYKWTNTKARIFELNNNYYIGLDDNQINTSIEEKEVLAEELGHYYYDATYKFDSDLNLIGKQEYRAKKWAYYALVPFENLKSAILKRN